MEERRKDISKQTKNETIKHKIDPKIKVLLIVFILRPHFNEYVLRISRCACKLTLSVKKTTMTSASMRIKEKR